MRKTIIALVPLALMAIFIGLRVTVGEANPVIYALMALPAPGWPLLFLLIAIVYLFKKKRIFALLYALAAIGIIFPLLNPCFSSPKTGRAKALRMMTFNVQKFQNFTPDQVAAAIRKENPDIVCLQEANMKAPPNPLPKAFHSALPDYQIVQRGQTAILSKFPVTFSNSFALRSGTDGRPAQMTTVMVQGQPITIICVHMQYFPWDGSISVAQASRNLIKETRSLEDLVKEPGVATIVAGDFNTLPHGRTHRMMRQYMTDCFATTSSGFGLTLPAVFPVKRLDYIYVSNGLAPIKSWISSIIASDHRAVVADIAWE